MTYLAQAASLGASLVVAVNSDESVRMLGKGPDRPINSENDRAAVLAALESTACVVIFKDKVPLEVVKKSAPTFTSRAEIMRSLSFLKPRSFTHTAEKL